MEEVWKDIEGYEGLYQVSNLGRVKSLDRTIAHKRFGQCKRKGVILKQVERRGYLWVDLTGKNKAVSVHRLVAEAFIPKLKGKNQVNHIDENRSNNRVDNLEWVTPYENMHHSDLQDRLPRNRKAIRAYDKTGKLVFVFNSATEAERDGFSRMGIVNNLRGRAKSSGGYFWKYE